MQQNIQYIKRRSVVQLANQSIAKNESFPHGGINLAQKNSNQVDDEFDPEKEFAIILDSALNPAVPQAIHYVNRTRKLRIFDKDNFWTLAAETVVACFSRNHSKVEKYHNMILHLKKARNAVDGSLHNEAVALEKIEKLAEMIIDIFDY